MPNAPAPKSHLLLPNRCLCPPSRTRCGDGSSRGGHHVPPAPRAREHSPAARQRLRQVARAGSTLRAAVRRGLRRGLSAELRRREPLERELADGPARAGRDHRSACRCRARASARAWVRRPGRGRVATRALAFVLLTNAPDVAAVTVVGIALRLRPLTGPHAVGRTLAPAVGAVALLAGVASLPSWLRADARGPR